MKTLRTLAAGSCTAILAFGLTGCATNFAPTNLPTQSNLPTISGQTMGGRQPISGAHIYLLETSSTGYGGPGEAAVSTNKSTSLLKSVTNGNFPTALDSSGGATNGMYYVTTDATGKFSITNEYNACTSGHQVYLYSLGGNPGGGTNSAAGLLASLGACGSFTSATTVNMNEVSTIALAYAMAGFATDATHVGILDSTLAETGLANAFANANQLFDTTSNPYSLSNTPARTTTPDGNGTVPQRQIDTLANIIAACVDSASSASSQCSTLFTNLQSSGATAGTKATDTATEAIYMAHNPSVSSIYSVTGVGAPNPYTPWLDGSSGHSAPTDLTISLTFSGGGLSRPDGIAIDASGNAWVANLLRGLTELSPTGKALTPSSGYGNTGTEALAIDATSTNVWLVDGYTDLVHVTVSAGAPTTTTTLNPTGLVQARAISIDATGNLWIADSHSTGEYVDKLTSTGTPVSGSPFHTGSNNIPTPYAIVNDTLGNAWEDDFENNAVAKFNSAGVGQGVYTTGSLNTPIGLAVDSSNNVWAVNFYGSSVTKISNDGTTLTNYGGGGLNEPNFAAIDGGNNVWVLDQYELGITEFSNAGAALTPHTFGSDNGSFSTPTGLAIDGSGNAWVNEYINNVVVEYIGIATPVTTPLAYAVKNSKLGSRP